jgi:Cu2+-exporting ATPase
MANHPGTTPEKINDSASQKLSLNGMRCAACAQLIEFRLKQLTGVSTVRMNFAANRVDVSWYPAMISLHKIIDAVQDLGYGAMPEGDQGGVKRQKTDILRLFVAAFAMMQSMMYAFPAYLQPHPEVGGDLSPDIDHLLKLACLALALPVLLFSATPFYRSAWRDIKNRHVGMDVPVSIGILATFFMSSWATFFGGHVYFDSMIMFVCLLLAGRMIEARVHQKSTAALRSLTQLTPNYALQLPGFPQSRNTTQIEARQLRVNDYVLVPPGAQIPADGIVVEGTSECDESWMSGESKPQAKQVNSPLIGGSVNISGPLIMCAQQVANSTQFARLLGMMESASNEKPPLVALADRHASHFLTVILLLSVVTGIVWWQIDPARAIWIAISVLVVTCPCALSLATPGVMSAVIGLLAKHGVLVAKGSAIEGMARARHIVFDKTGTLTEGKLKVAACQIWREEALPVCAAITAHSLHPASKALANAFPESELIPDDIGELPGQGMYACFSGKNYRLGRITYVQALCGQSGDITEQLPAIFNASGQCAFGDEQGIIAIFALDDVLRPDALLMAQQLKAMGKTLHILSGDNPNVVQHIAAQLNLDHAVGNMSPEEKYLSIQALQKQGEQVVMVGDGMNDGPGLSIANVSVAMGQGAPITQARSDVLLLSNRLPDFAYAVKMCQRSMRLIKENLAWAVAYNLLAIPAAVTGFIQPWHAAVGMTLSSLIVVGNSLRLLIGNKG